MTLNFLNNKYKMWRMQQQTCYINVRTRAKGKKHSELKQNSENKTINHKSSEATSATVTMLNISAIID